MCVWWWWWWGGSFLGPVRCFAVQGSGEVGKINTEELAKRKASRRRALAEQVRKQEHQQVEASRVRRTVPDKYREKYGNFDIILDHLLAHFSAPPHPTRTVCFTPRRAYTGRVLIGVWNPML